MRTGNTRTELLIDHAELLTGLVLLAGSLFTGRLLLSLSAPSTVAPGLGVAMGAALLARYCYATDFTDLYRATPALLVGTGAPLAVYTTAFAGDGGSAATLAALGQGFPRTTLFTVAGSALASLTVVVCVMGWKVAETYLGRTEPFQVEIE